MKLWIGAFTCGALALAGFWAVTPTPEGISISGHVLAAPCLFKVVTGMPCPGCGMTRSVAYSLHGHPLQALSFHWFGPLAAAFIVLLILIPIARLALAASGRARPAFRISDRAAALSLLSFIAFMTAHWLYRLATAPH